MLGEATGTPVCRFVERVGERTIMDLLGRSNPWAKDWWCDRKECLPCQGRQRLARDVEERPVPQPGSTPLPRPAREDVLAIPKCTSEGIGYYLECWGCRLIGKRYQYVGESSRSMYQRGREHLREVNMGKKTHPLVDHFMEQHQGK